MVRAKFLTSDPAGFCPWVTDQQGSVPRQGLCSHRQDCVPREAGSPFPFPAPHLVLLSLQVAVEARKDKRHLSCGQRQKGQVRSPGGLGNPGDMRDETSSLWFYPLLLHLPHFFHRLPQVIGELLGLQVGVLEVIHTLGSSPAMAVVSQMLLG